MEAAVYFFIYHPSAALFVFFNFFYALTSVLDSPFVKRLYSTCMVSSLWNKLSCKSDPHFVFYLFNKVKSSQEPKVQDKWHRLLLLYIQIVTDKHSKYYYWTVKCCKIYSFTINKQMQQKSSRNLLYLLSYSLFTCKVSCYCAFFMNSLQYNLVNHWNVE